MHPLLDIKEKDRKEKKKHLKDSRFYDNCISEGEHKRSVGSQHKLRGGSYRRESESGDGSVKTVNLQSSGVRVGASMEWSPPTLLVQGGAMESAPPDPQNPFCKNFKGRVFTFTGGGMVFPRFTYATYLIKYIYLFRLSSRMLWALLFPHP